MYFNKYILFQDFDLVPCIIYPLSSIPSYRVKREPPFRGMVNIRDKFLYNDEFVHWDSDYSDSSDDEMSDSLIQIRTKERKVKSLMELAMKNIFTEGFLGKLPRKRRKIKSEITKAESLLDSLLNDEDDMFKFSSRKKDDERVTNDFFDFLKDNNDENTKNEDKDQKDLNEYSEEHNVENKMQNEKEDEILTGVTDKDVEHSIEDRYTDLNIDVEDKTQNKENLENDIQREKEKSTDNDVDQNIKAKPTDVREDIESKDKMQNDIDGSVNGDQILDLDLNLDIDKVNGDNEELESKRIEEAVNIIRNGDHSTDLEECNVREKCKNPDIILEKDSLEVYSNVKELDSSLDDRVSTEAEELLDQHKDIKENVEFNETKEENSRNIDETSNEATCDTSEDNNGHINREELTNVNEEETLVSLETKEDNLTEELNNKDTDTENSIETNTNCEVANHCNVDDFKAKSVMDEDFLMKETSVNGTSIDFKQTKYSEEMLDKIAMDAQLHVNSIKMKEDDQPMDRLIDTLPDDEQMTLEDLIDTKKDTCMDLDNISDEEFNFD